MQGKIQIFKPSALLPMPVLAAALLLPAACDDSEGAPEDGAEDRTAYDTHDASDTPAETDTPVTPEIETVHVAEGEFIMGSLDGVGMSNERPQHTVFVSSFYMARYETSNAQYMMCVDAGACTPPHVEPSAGQEDHPAATVDFTQAAAFCTWAGGRLPTEAEWEKAARSTDGRTYPWGEEDPDGRAQFNADTSVPVTEFESGESAFGARNMVGNVCEWTNDYYAADYFETSPYRDPAGPETGTERVLKGGNFRDSADSIRCAMRRNKPEDFFIDMVGFRCAFDE